VALFERKHPRHSSQRHQIKETLHGKEERESNFDAERKKTRLKIEREIVGPPQTVAKKLQ